MRRAVLSGFALTLTSALVACSGGGTQANEQVAEEDLVSVMPAASGDVDRITWNLTTGEPDTLDPRNAVNYSSGQVVRNMCESVLAMDPEFGITSGLASVDQRSPTELVLTIDENAKFWDGTPVTPDDVVYSLNRSADPTDSVVSFAFVSLESVSATGPNEVTVRLTEPDSMFMQSMATISGAVIKKEWAEAAGDGVGTPEGGLMCSGPFELQSWDSGSRITMVRNDAYWNPELRPFASEVEFRFVTDASAVTQALQAGEIDGAYELPASVVPSLRTTDAGQLTLGPSTQGVNIAVARPDGPLADVAIREALQRAIDRDALSSSVFNGAAQPNYTHLTSTTWPNSERDAYQVLYDQFAEERAFDVEEAKTMVENSSYDGSPIVMVTRAGDDVMSRLAQLVQQQAKSIGLNVEVQVMQPLIFAQAQYDPSARVGVDLILSTSFNSGQNPLEPLGFDLLPGESYNYTNFDNPEVTRLLSEARASDDLTKQTELILEAQKIYEPDSSVISLVNTYTTTFVNKRLTGAVTSFAYWSMPQMAYIGSAS
ncbi:ABC transporter substrate-binding protein [Rhodococcoides kroppenstedtii]|uniref:ABC transporter substrate-binding protein n=1 Tax=Rhodococcoides kroppenstedtii TaxID=293050 RepID=UPI0028E44A29|nr:ABC transporter substrate-binding protein [Rhodococcus kroppenstedtii]